MRILACISVVVSLLAVSGCTQAKDVACAVEKSAIVAVSDSVAGLLQCSNKDAVSAAVSKAASGINFCPAPAPSGVSGLKANSVGSVICDLFASALISSVASGGIPKDWGCSAENAQALLKQAASAGCAKIL